MGFADINHEMVFLYVESGMHIFHFNRTENNVEHDVL